MASKLHGYSTTLCTNVLNNIVNHYVTEAVTCLHVFVDFSKAFDRINCRELFKFLIDNNISAACLYCVTLNVLVL